MQYFIQAICNSDKKNIIALQTKILMIEIWKVLPKSTYQLDSNRMNNQKIYACPLYFLLYLYYLQTCSAQQTISNPNLSASNEGLPYLLLAIVFGLIFFIPIFLWVYRNYLSHALKFLNLKITVYSAKAYERASMRISDAGRKISERVRV